MRQKVTLFLLLFSLLTGKAQDRNQETFTIVFYNVENLFNTTDNPGTEDEEFTPMGEKEWDEEKYEKKLKDIAEVISSVNRKELPEIIGLAEVENRKVLEDLIEIRALRKGDYVIVHEESPDRRGIDVALLYRKDELRSVKHSAINVDFPFDSTLTTRDILHVEGKAPDGKKIHFFINHWSSRSGGVKESEPKRMYAAVNLRRRIDLLLSRESDPRIVIMGDFNDEPTNRSLMNILLASNKRKNIGPGDLYNLYYDRHNLGNEGTYNYRGKWNMLDHIIVSYNLINQRGFYSCGYDDGRIFKEEWMLYETEEGIKVPNRTYGGTDYYGGISDHFPVYLELGIGE